MNGKQIWAIMIVSLIVAVITSVVTVNLMTSPFFSPKNSIANAYVKAHSCDADEVCEVNEVVISSGQQTLEIGQNLEVNGSLYKNYIATNDRSLTLIPNVDGLFGTTRVIHALGAMSVYHPDYPERGTVLIGLGAIVGNNPDETIEIGERLKIRGMDGGDGNSYVCVDSEGLLFRSNTSCR